MEDPTVAEMLARCELKYQVLSGDGWRDIQESEIVVHALEHGGAEIRVRARNSVPLDD